MLALEAAAVASPSVGKTRSTSRGRGPSSKRVLASAAGVEGSRRVCAGLSELRTHWGKWSRSRGHTERARRSAELLTVEAAASTVSGRSKGSRTRALWRVHAIVLGRRGRWHGRIEARVGDHGCRGSAGAAAQAADVLGKVVVLACLGAALPVTGTERDHTAAAAAGMHAVSVAVATAAHVMTATHNIGRIAVAIAATTPSLAHVLAGTVAHGGV